MTVKHNLLLCHRCILAGHGQHPLPSTRRWLTGAAGTGGVSLPAAPQADDTCPGPHQAGGNGSPLCVSAPCPVTAPKPVLGYRGCAVSSDRASQTAAVQHHGSPA